MTNFQRTDITHSNSPILKLYTELIWYIFCLNSVMDQDGIETSALHTLRRSSQVCSKWRRLILSSSSLWGQVLNLRFLRKPEWREEVMRRTGDSLLSVAGDIRDVWNIEEGVVSLLDEHWPRIRFLDLHFSKERRRLPEDKIWRIFQRPASSLQVLRFSFPEFEYAGRVVVPSYSDSPPSFVVFDNQAPSLHTFEAPNIRFDLRAPWLSHIRDLSLNVPIPVDDLLRAMSHMPLMESLHDSKNAITHANSAASLQEVSSPSLEMIDVAPSRYPTDLSPYKDFLAHITPAPSCRLSFYFWLNQSDSNAFETAPEILQIYSRYPDWVATTEIYFSMSRWNFEFKAKLPCGVGFYFGFEARGSYDLTKAVDALLVTLSTLPFPNVQTLKIVNNDEEMSALDSKLIGFILSIPSLEVLQTSPGSTLQSLFHLPVEILDHAFPALHTFEITRGPEVADLQATRTFLTRRIEIGRPIRTLDISNLGTQKVDVRDFIDLAGLKVIISSWNGEN